VKNSLSNFLSRNPAGQRQRPLPDDSSVRMWPNFNMDEGGIMSRLYIKIVYSLYTLQHNKYSNLRHWKDTELQAIW